jgi:hypothetical protein
VGVAALQLPPAAGGSAGSADVDHMHSGGERVWSRCGFHSFQVQPVNAQSRIRLTIFCATLTDEGTCWHRECAEQQLRAGPGGGGTHGFQYDRRN